MSVGTARYPAPAVQYPVGRSMGLTAFLVLAQLVSLMVLVLWLMQGAGADRAPMVPSLLIWCAAAAIAARFWSRLPVGVLSWDGEQWSFLRADGVPKDEVLGDAVVVQLDVQRCMALAFPAARPARWLFVERHCEPVRWLDLRRAVYSRPSAARAQASDVPSQPEGHSS